MDRDTVFTIRIAERLSADWTGWLDGLQVIPSGEAGTLLCCRLPDQAALLGLLNRLHGLNLTLLSVEAEPGASPERNGGG